MNARLKLYGASAFAMLCLSAAPVFAQNVDFGDDTSVWAMDGECDDPRFEGEGMAPQPSEADVLGDATDCMTLFDGGMITLAGGGSPTAPANPGKPGAATEAAATGDVDFGDDSSAWSNDGECDDPRFIGDGMALQPQDVDIMADATDCRTLFDAGMISITGGDDADPAMADAGAVDFGQDTSAWANDGECDDPRFVGDGMALQPQDVDIMADATDCQSLYDAGMIALAGAGAPDGNSTKPAAGGEVDFGADSGEWTFDGECDDPRFVGQGMAEVLVDADLFADATDCRTLYDAGMITLADGGMADSPAGNIDFGADSGQWTNDGECDDPRFSGPGSADVLVEADLFADATDCRTLFDAGQVTYVGE